MGRAGLKHDANFRKYLTTKQGMDGYTLSNIEWSDRVGETKVTVSKDGQFSTLSFNQALLASPLPRAGDDAQCQSCCRPLPT